MITIEQPDIEALIQHRLVQGRFESVEAVLTQALTDAPLPAFPCLCTPPRSGAELYEALLNSPYKEVSLEGQRYYAPVSDPVEF